jgi:hypothetical protein
MIENTFGDTDYHRRVFSSQWAGLAHLTQRMEVRSAVTIIVMPGLVPGIPLNGVAARKTWMAGQASMTAINQRPPEETKMKSTPFDLTGKVAVITGSSRGIGNRSSAELLANSAPGW